MSYRLLRPLLFRLPAETAHHVGSALLAGALGTAAARAAARRAMAIQHPALRCERWGIQFPNPVGLAAGFDKAGTHLNALGALGFGFVEIGTVTAFAQPGNARPRMFRLPADQALLNRMGFNKPGAEAVARRLAQSQLEPILGINLGKSKATPLADADDDYLRSMERLQEFAAYLVVNVSSPNTPGLRQLQDAEPLRQLLRALFSKATRPLLLKIAPDLTDDQVDQATDIAADEGVSGIVATNTTTVRHGLRTPVKRLEAFGAGGISGAPVHRRALEIVARVHRRTQGALPIVGVGGIFDADQAWSFIRAGASLVQIWTGFVYGGPLTPRRINQGLVEHLERGGFRRLDEAVGSGL